MSKPSIHEVAACGAATVHQLVEAARAHGLDIETTQTSFEETGLDFRVVHGTDPEGTAWILRTPRRPAVIEVARGEARVLRFVAPRLPVRVPEWRVHDDVVIGYPRLDGTPAVTVTEGHPTWNVIDPAALPSTFLDSYATMLAALQRVDIDEAESAGVSRCTIERARAEIAVAIESSRAALAPSDAIWRRWQRWLENDALWPTHVALVHGDLHPGHLLLGDDGALLGVLDWTEAKVTDPSVDLAMFFGCFGAAAFDDVLGRFERAGGRGWPGLTAHARERWFASPALAADWALRAGSDAALEHARAHLAAMDVADRTDTSSG